MGEYHTTQNCELVEVDLASASSLGWTSPRKKDPSHPQPTHLTSAFADHGPRLNNSRPTSPLRRTLTLELLLRRRRLRDSAGSAGFNPLARACRFRISVRLTTPTSFPDSRAPGNAEAGTDGAIGGGSPGDVAVWESDAVFIYDCGGLGR